MSHTFWTGVLVVVTLLGGGVFMQLGASFKPAVIMSLVLIGGFALCLGSVCSWNWFWSHEKAMAMIERFGKTGTRILYFVLGLIMMSIGMWLVCDQFLP